MKIDRRKNYYLTLDVETANSLEDPLVYDLGGAIHDKKGNVLEAFSFIIPEVFFYEKELMESAYYADKRESYTQDIALGLRRVVPFQFAKKHIEKLSKKYKIKAIIAHNAIFDYRALQSTQRYLTKSKNRWFFPYGVPIYCTFKMAKQTIAKQKSYISWATENGYIGKNNQIRLTAELLYRYWSGLYNFDEAHTGLEDVYIQIDIFQWIMRQKKSINKNLFKARAE